MKNLPDYYSVRLIASALRRFDEEGHFRRIVPIPKAKVPIGEQTMREQNDWTELPIKILITFHKVKFVHGRSGLSSDININDTFGNVNSEMIRAYIDVGPELIQPFLFAVKRWGSKRGINDPSGKSGVCSLNSYTICMM